MTKIILRRRSDVEAWRGSDIREFELYAYEREDFSYRDMRYLDFQGDDLSQADLTGADLTGAILVDASLRGACLLNTILTDVNLMGADLKGVSYLATAKHKNILQIRPFKEGRWPIAAYVNKDENLLAIGCQPAKTIDEWEAMTDEEIAAMNPRALPFQQREKEHIISEARRKCAEFRAREA